MSKKQAVAQDGQHEPAQFFWGEHWGRIRTEGTAGIYKDGTAGRTHKEGTAGRIHTEGTGTAVCVPLNVYNFS